MNKQESLPRGSARGFTLAEMMVTISVIGIMSALAVNGIRRMIPRIEGSRSIDELTSVLGQAARIAVSNRTHIWVGFKNPGTGAPAPYPYFLFEDWDGNFDPATFNPLLPGAQVANETLIQGKRYDRLRARGELYRNVTFESQSKLSVEARSTIPVYFQSDMLRANPTSGARKGCSICDGTKPYLWLHFSPDGELVETVPPADPGANAAAFVFGLKGQVRGNLRAVVVAIPSGLVEVYNDI